MELASGNVSDRPWGVTLATVWRKQATGRLTLRFGTERIVIAFRRGSIVNSTSSIGNDDDVGRRAARSFAIEMGTFVLDDEQPEVSHHNVDPRAVIFFGARFVLPDVRLVEDLRTLGERFKLTISDVELAYFGIAPTEPAIEVLRRGAAVTDFDRNGRAIVYALACCGACAIERAPGDGLVGALAAGTERVPTMNPALVAPPRRVPTPPFGVRIVTEKTRVPTPSDGVPVPMAPASTASRRKTLTQLQEKAARRVDHFELLGVPFDAPAETVRAAYLALARQIQGAPSEPTPRVFSQLINAFSVLTDPQRRAAYMATLAPIVEKQVVPDAAMVESASAAFAAGDAALAAGKFDDAIVELERAVQLAPEHVNYKATLAWAQFCAAPNKEAVAENTRRLLAGAVPRSEDPVVPVYYLACVAKELGRDREALRLYQRVLHLDPEHADARREVRALHERGDKRGLLDRFRR